MSGNHNFTARSAEKTTLDQVMEEKFYESYGGANAPGWYQTSVANAKEPGRMAGLAWEVYKQAFHDGFAARLSGVKDE